MRDEREREQKYNPSHEVFIIKLDILFHLICNYISSPLTSRVSIAIMSLYPLITILASKGMHAGRDIV